MKKFTILSIMLLFMAGTVFAATNVGKISSAPIVLDNGGPDAFGYHWEDNDNGGSPVYEWIDISTIGTPVSGLADDNNVGPFSMGFNFPYYWYTANRCWIGSNGYISFSSSANFAHPFAGIPTSNLPNDLIAVLTGDLDFTQGSNPQCFYYTNSVDTFIVSWINVREFGDANSHHTFQVIFSAADSTIKFQYGANQGTFLDSNGQNKDVIGIENVNGQVGVEYLHDNLPAQRMWHEGLAIKFWPEPDPNFVVHDFGMIDGYHDGSGAVYVPVNEPYTLRGYAKNFGNQPEDSLRVRCQIRRGFSQVYDQSVYISHLDPGQGQWVDFPVEFTPDQVTVYKTTFSAIMSGDQNSFNNTKICELDAYTLPQEISYCDDIAEDGRSWNGDFSGFGVEFQMPQRILVTSASFNVYSVTAAGPAYVWILPDNGHGQPDEDNSLAGDTVTVTAEGWVTIDFSSSNLEFAPNEKFYVVALHAFQSTFAFSMDQTSPLSYRGWEYTGGLAGDRDRELSDIMIKIAADAATSVDDAPTPNTFAISQNYPNPFNARTNISFNIVNDGDVAIGVYNLMGQKVADLSGHFNAGENVVTWDAAAVASGVYFYRIDADNRSETKKMVLLK